VARLIGVVGRTGLAFALQAGAMTKALHLSGNPASALPSLCVGLVWSGTTGQKHDLRSDFFVIPLTIASAAS